MSRLQLALNVTDVDAAVEFCSGLFAMPVNKRKPGDAEQMANRVIDTPEGACCAPASAVAEPVSIGTATDTGNGC